MRLRERVEADLATLDEVVAGTRGHYGSNPAVMAAVVQSLALKHELHRLLFDMNRSEVETSE